MEVEKTINRMFRQSTARFGGKAACRYKVAGAYQTISYAELGERVENFGMGLMSLGFETESHGAILSSNRPEWAVADLAMAGAAGVVVPIYPTLVSAQIRYLLEESECLIVVVEDEDQLAKIRAIKDRLPTLRWVVVMNGELGVREEWLLSFSEVTARGAAARERLAGDYRQRAVDRRPDDLLSIIYTSGTTGVPKGVMLTHGNLMANIQAALQVFDFCSRDEALSFLPLSHILERMAGYYLMLSVGVTISYAESINTVPRNLVEVQPTVVVSVPRLYEKMYTRVLDSIAHAPGIQRNLFNWAMSVGRRHYAAKTRGDVPPWLALRNRLADLLVFTRIRARLGGRLRFFISGGAPLEPQIAEFFAACGVMIYEGYGLTETSPVTNVNRIGHVKFGTVGPTLPGVEVRIAEDGEIMVRGPNVMKGYYKNPEETAEAIDTNGWFATGDVGVVDADGFLRITDRKKEIIVTSGGKNIAPQPLENLFKTSRFISQVMVVGDRRKYLAALIVPDFENLRAWRAQQGMEEVDQGLMVRDPRVIGLVEDEVRRLQADLPRFEQIKRFHLLDKELSIDDGELTPTLKVRRNVIQKRYGQVIERLFPRE
ncbi:long-chain fatty acid--CoA ligase [bacterium]|nr:long-chain fatty acid--CoA ligase [candidate division CSSED10-310 bacterium]